MLRRLIFVLGLGLCGAAVLIALGLWQMRRLEWKEAMLAEIEARIAAAPVAVPVEPDPEADRFLPVAARGVVEAPILQVLASRKNSGAGYRLIAPFVLADGRRVMIDLGFVDIDAALPGTGAEVEVTGNLHWPQEVDGFTPDPDREQHLWYARDVAAMAADLGTEPVLIVRRTGGFPGVDAMPVGTEGIPNDHLGYAVTWFSLAAIWLAMTGILVYRMRKPEGAET